MRTSAKRAPTADEVERFLTENPNFIKQRDDLLMKLEIPHRLNGATSLIEYQVRRLRTQMKQLQVQTETMIANGCKNEELEGKVHLLTLSLLRCQRLPSLFSALYQELQQQFEINEARVHLLYPPRRAANAKLVELATDKERLRELFSKIIDPPKALYGNLSEAQCQALFGSDITLMHYAVSAGSCAVIPLVTDKAVGLLAMMSTDASRFSTIQSSHYLLHLGETIAAVLRRWLDYGDRDR